MKLTTQVRYAVRCLCDIAYNSAGTLARIGSIAERQCISPHYIEQIFQKLKKAGLIVSVRGPAGGYYLAKKPEEISVGDVIRAVEGEGVRLVMCAGRKKEKIRPCPRYGRCVVSEVWGKASDILNEYFESITLERLCTEAKEKGLDISGPFPSDPAAWRTICPYAA